MDESYPMHTTYKNGGLKENYIERNVQTHCDNENVYMAERWQIQSVVMDLLSLSLPGAIEAVLLCKWTIKSQI